MPSGPEDSLSAHSRRFPSDSHLILALVRPRGIARSPCRSRIARRRRIRMPQSDPRAFFTYMRALRGRCRRQVVLAGLSVCPSLSVFLTFSRSGSTLLLHTHPSDPTPPRPSPGALQARSGRGTCPAGSRVPAMDGMPNLTEGTPCRVVGLGAKQSQTGRSGASASRRSSTSA